MLATNNALAKARQVFTDHGECSAQARRFGTAFIHVRSTFLEMLAKSNRSARGFTASPRRRPFLALI